MIAHGCLNQNQIFPEIVAPQTLQVGHIPATQQLLELIARQTVRRAAYCTSDSQKKGNA
jgi:hypothetical protein